jgi:hypothetical protein
MRGLDAEMPEETTEADEEEVEEVERLGDNGAEEKEYHLMSMYVCVCVCVCEIIEPPLRGERCQYV